ncbi:MAG TPA: ATP-binding protein [Oscillatoriaceae cyanobacterium]
MESKTLEYKEVLYPFSRARDADQEKIRQEAMRDISALANAEGGDIIFGINKKIEVVGLRDKDDPDAFVDRLTLMLDSNVTPKIAGIQHRLIACGDKRVLILRVPKSFAAPHMVGETTNSFWARSTTGKRQLDVTELRYAFTTAGVLGDRLRDERGRRLRLIVDGRTPIELEYTNRVVLHIFPLQAFASNRPMLSPDQIATFRRNRRLKTFHSGELGSESWLINFDGALAYQSTQGGRAQAYTQVFRSGAIEAVDSTFIVEGNGKLWFNSRYEGEVVETTRSYLELLESLEIHPPYLIALSLVGVNGMVMPEDHGQSPGHMVSETDLVLPDFDVETWPLDLHAAFKPVFDMVWQAMGLECSPNYDAAGRWAPRRK